MNVRRTIQSAVFLPVALVGSIALLLAFQVRDLLRDAEWVRHTVQVRAEVYETQKLLLDQETGIRGWLLTRDPRFLAPYTSGAATLPATLKHLESLTADAPARQARVHDLRARYEAWYASAETSRVDASPASIVTISPQLQSTMAERKASMDEMRRVAEQMLADENKLEGERQARLAARVRTFALTGAALFLLFALVSTTLLRRWINQLDAKFADALREQTEARHSAEALATASLEQSREFEQRYLELAARVQKDERA